jgi:3-deoxy-7-phosphoheptulonate synthase
VVQHHPLISPNLLRYEYPKVVVIIRLPQTSADMSKQSDISIKTVTSGRSDASQILNGQDDRLLVIVEPITLSDLLLAVRLEQQYPELCIMILCGPHSMNALTGSANNKDWGDIHRTNKYLRAARSLMVSLSSTGVRLAIQASDTLEASFVEDLASLFLAKDNTQPCIEMASSLSYPVGIPYTTQKGSGSMAHLMDTVNKSHCFLGISPAGMATIVQSSGNPQGFSVVKWTDHGAGWTQTMKANIEERQRSTSLVLDCRDDFDGTRGTYAQALDSITELLSHDTTALVGLVVSMNTYSAKSSGLMGAKDFLGELSQMVQHRRLLESGAACCPTEDSP